MRKLMFGLAVAVAAFASAPAAAATFFENFDKYPANVPWSGSGVWTTGNSVDLVASGTYNLTCVGGAGNCVDLSGDRPGTLSTSIFLAPGSYQLAFLATGNQLDSFYGPYPQSSINYSIGLLSGSTGLLTNTSTAFQSYGGLFTITTGGSYLLTFSQAPGGDPYRGSIIDNVSISAVPEPATWGMMLLGFGLMGFGLRRRRSEVRNVELAR